LDIIVKMCLFILVTLIPSTVCGGLVIHVSGQSGGATTTWIFSGSGTTTAAGRTGTARLEWVGGDFATTTVNNLTATRGEVTISGSALGSAVTTNRLGIVAGGVDSFHLRGDVRGVNYSVGTVAWSGTLIVPVSIDYLSATPLPAVISSLLPENGHNDRAFQGVSLDLNISHSSVPEPGPFLGCSLVIVLGAIHRLRRSRRKRNQDSLAASRCD
jgi:hypothetical protein